MRRKPWTKFDYWILAILLIGVTIFGAVTHSQTTGSATLSWTAPTENEDGSPIPAEGDDALAGFKIYWGTVEGTYPNVVDIPDPTATSYVITNLEPGTYTFVGTAYNNAGIESRYSNTATKEVTIDVEYPFPPIFF